MRSFIRYYYFNSLLFLHILQTFEFVTNEDDSVAYLYRLTNGHTTRSFAHAAARSAGLDEQVVKRAVEVIEDFVS